MTDAMNSRLTTFMILKLKLAQKKVKEKKIVHMYRRNTRLKIDLIHRSLLVFRLHASKLIGEPPNFVWDLILDP